MRLRIVAGAWGGRPLAYPRGAEIRPTAEAVREALFSSLAEETAGARWADLFAGTGAVGLEALSRGAARAVFLEKNPRCVEAVRANAANLSAGERAIVVPGAVESQWRTVAERHGPFDVVFADPPYAYEGWEKLLERLVGERAGRAEEGLVIIEHARRRPLPEAFRPEKEKVFGETAVAFYW